jgi:CMP-N-acetylneuraminic acid synthetase|tara:strand:+ start:72 stop:731 length:660 start_codon:yes stop_codon:yes gene_type:complete
MDICGLIATRKDSKRVKNKATRKFGSSNLSIIKINQALKIKKFKNIYFSSDIPELNRYALKKGLILIQRPKKYLGKCTISDLAPYLVKQIKESHICYLMNTSPLLELKTLQKAVNIYEKLNFSRYDGLNTFEIVKDFLWGKNEPINYKLNKQPMSQNLGGVYKHIPAVSIMSKKKIIKFRNVLGKKPYKIFLKQPESFDIDTIYDFKISELYYKKRKNK